MVCTHGLPTDTCATSGSDGKYTISIGFPDGLSKVTGTATCPGYLGKEHLYIEDPTPSDSYVVGWTDVAGLMTTQEATGYLAHAAGFTYPTTTSGFLRLSVHPDATGHYLPATATISPPVAASGPMYSGNLNYPDPTLTDSSASGVILFGNLPPGTYAVTVKSPGRTCTVRPSPTGSTFNNEWPPVGSETFSAAVSASMITDDILVACD
jgi:hypothetical protein